MSGLTFKNLRFCLSVLLFILAAICLIQVVTSAGAQWKYVGIGLHSWESLIMGAVLLLLGWCLKGSRNANPKA
jgi:hypothetical protein